MGAGCGDCEEDCSVLFVHRRDVSVSILVHDQAECFRSVKLSEKIRTTTPRTLLKMMMPIAIRNNIDAAE